VNSEIQSEAEYQSVDLLNLTGEIVSAYVSNKSVTTGDLPTLLHNVHTALASLYAGRSLQTRIEAHDKPTAAQIRKSVSPDGIVSFVDGKTYKTMKRHLTTNGLDPQSYRNRFGLPTDYPMVAPNYAAQRSALAKSIGLGRPRGHDEPAEPVKALARKKAG
jgi:predicted transcriptional regulator